METRSSKRRKLLINQQNEVEKRVPEVDRISDLPDAILHHILFLLPIKTIAQTSVLSKRWRYIWYSFPDLDFTTIYSLSYSSTNHKGVPSPSSYGIDINQVLALRGKHTDIRILRFQGQLSFSRLNSLIRQAVRHNVQELDIEIVTEDHFNLPRCIITSESLRVFRLKSHYPGFRLPPSSIMKSGFQSLHTLSLSLIMLAHQPTLLDLFTDSSFPLLKKLSLDNCFGLEGLDVRCRGLQDLTLGNCFQLQGLDISGAKLERLTVASCFDAYNQGNWVKISAPKLKQIYWDYNSITENSYLENLACLEEASVGFFVLQKDISSAKLGSVSNLLAGFSNAHCLTFENPCIEILSNKHYIAVPLNPFNSLKSLKLHTGFNKNNIAGLACLFRSCPTLHTLTLKLINEYKIERRQWNRDLWEFSSSEEEHYWESQSEALKSFLHHLRVVKIHGFLECVTEISFAKFLLKHGRTLQEMILYSEQLKSRDVLRRQKIRSQMMAFSRASANAKIRFR